MEKFIKKAKRIKNVVNDMLHPHISGLTLEYVYGTGKEPVVILSGSIVMIFLMLYELYRNGDYAARMLYCWRLEQCTNPLIRQVLPLMAARIQATCSLFEDSR